MKHEHKKYSSGLIELTCLGREVQSVAQEPFKDLSMILWGPSQD